MIELIQLGGHFDIEAKTNELNNLTEKMNKDDFWNDVDSANEICSKVSNIKKELIQFNNIKDTIDSYTAFVDENDNDLLTEISNNLENLEKDLASLEINTLLNNEYDTLNCYLELHPGAGGTESCDWANMLFRMYTRFCEKNNYSYEIIDYQKGDEAGIKSCTLLIKGLFSYGYLKNEKGVHRLVRISPFDSNGRRHTSFVSVMVTPVFKNNINIEIDESDLKIDVYHSSGAGGQSVNTSDSAVRITHIPSKIVVSCQTERSQLKNKEKAMEMLKNKLYQRELEKKEQKMNDIIGDNRDINFGSQIRSYILEPYKMVKDHRTDYQTSEADKVLDGDILDFLKEALKIKKEK